jgi:hypothetical protein
VSDRAIITLRSQADRDKASKWAQGVTAGSKVVFLGPARTVPQNDMMWQLLRTISKQLEWHGQRYPPEEWKDFIAHALRRSKWMPSEDGGMVPIGLSTSSMSRAEMSDMIECIYAFGARHGVEFDAEEARDAYGPEADKP